MKLDFVFKIIKNCSMLIWNCVLKPFLGWVKEKINKAFDSFLSPHVISILTMTLLTFCFGEDVTNKMTHSITDTLLQKADTQAKMLSQKVHAQAKMLLQKENLNPLQYQMTELWAATQMLFFLFKENDDKIKKNKEPKEIDKKRITKAYKYWNKLRLAWQDDFEKKCRYISELSGDKKERYCRQKKEFLTDLENQFKCVIQKQFDKFFSKLENCYLNYYSKNNSCKDTLPYIQDNTELNKKINLFYIEMSEAK